ncbi:MAG: NAD(P)-dependent oxidoreductase [Verrucomicrobia bacterium]|nr:NAD(P)-dependent oxidoreductase [Verrucomicrobiota bacterium]MDA1067059.1 NAD(P)-dependent oxidoreductase [Verrucomicrobiota bacterium]
MQNIGLIGAGVMGFTAAEKIIEAGYPLTVFEPNQASAARVQGLGAKLVTSPAEAAKQSDIVILFLPGPSVIEAVVAGTDGLLSTIREGSVIVDMSTTDPESTRTLATLAKSKNVGYLDAPVLGRPASIGKWALPVGGDTDEHLNKCMPVLNILATQIMPIGESGSGNKIKLLNQLMFGAINAMTAEMMAIADKVGISPELLYNTLTASQAGTVSNLFKELGKSISEDDYATPTFSVDLLCKDVNLATKLARQNGANPILGESIEAINKLAQDQGFGNKDTSIMWKCFRPLWETGAN